MLSIYNRELQPGAQPCPGTGSHDTPWTAHLHGGRDHAPAHFQAHGRRRALHRPLECLREVAQRVADHARAHRLRRARIALASSSAPAHRALWRYPGVFLFCCFFFPRFTAWPCVGVAARQAARPTEPSRAHQRRTGRQHAPRGLEREARRARRGGVREQLEGCIDGPPARRAHSCRRACSRILHRGNCSEPQPARSSCTASQAWDSML